MGKLTAPYYTPEELQFLADNYLHMSHDELATHLNRTKGAIKDKLKSMGLSRRKAMQKIVADLKATKQG